jgi:hypothetical protein
MLALLLVLASVLPLVFGQAQSSSADLKGSVVDPSGGYVADTKLTITDPQTGLTRTTTSERSGEFLFRSLPPSRYRLRAEAPGFAVKNLEGIELRVGDTVSLTVELSLSEVGTAIEVTSQAPVVEPERYQQSSTLERQAINNLPINRRNYLDLTLLTPGVSDTNSVADGNDFRVAQTPQSGLSFGGGNGRSNGFFVDGVENYSNSGGVRMSVSQEAVQEFQINRNSFSVEYGWTSGGTVNIVTRSGTNSVHGNFFGFLRQRELQARNYFDPGKASFTRVQAGATLGAPIRRDKTFVFLGFERLDRHEAEFVTILQDRSVLNRLTPSQKQLFDYFSASGNLLLGLVAAQGRQLLVPSANPAVAKLFDSNSGQFPYAEKTPTYSMRLDHVISERHNLFFRGNLTTLFQQNAQLGALIGYNRGRSFDGFDGTVALGDTLLLGPKWILDTRLMFNYNRQFVIPVDPIGPEIDVQGFGNFGREIFLPSSTYERHYQVLQNISYHRGQHTIKFGWDVNPVRDRARSETFFSGRFEFGEAIPLSSLFAVALGDPKFPATVAAFLTAQGRADLLQNLDAPINALQAYSLQLPIFYQQGFGDPNWLGWSKRYGTYFQDSWNVRPNLTLNVGLRYDVEVNPKVLGTDPNNVAPRFAFAWSPGSGRKMVIRGAYGIYFAPTYAQFANVADTLSGHQINQVLVTLNGLPLVTNPATKQPVTSADIYQGLVAEGVIGTRSIAASDLLQFGLKAAPGLPGRVVFGSDPVVNAYSEQASFEIQRAFGDYSVSVAYNFNRGAHIGQTLGRNLYYTGHLPDGQPTFGHFDESILQDNVYSYGANSFYHAGIVEVGKRMRRNLALNAHYTWSKAMDESTDFNSDYSPNDQLNARAERALSAFHHAHRVVFNAVYQSPVESRGGAPFYEKAAADWTISPILQYNSARPFNILTGFDNYGDNYLNNHRPWGAGRNIGIGPDFVSVDLRASRKFVLDAKKRWNLEVIAEGFNLANRTNFRTVNQVVGDVPLKSLPNPVRAFRGTPDQPLAYTSAFEPRQFQFGLKINY